MPEIYGCKITIRGLTKLMNAFLAQTKVNIIEFAVGDSNGSYYEPSQTQTALVNEVYRGAINSLEEHETNPNWRVVECRIPPQEGPFWIRELGLFDDEGEMIAIAKISASEKCVYEQGSTKDLRFETILAAKNASVINIISDPTKVWASRDYVDTMPKRDMKIYNVNYYGGIAETITASNSIPGYMFFPPGSHDPGDDIEIPEHLVAWFAPEAVLETDEETPITVTFQQPVRWEKQFVGDNVTISGLTSLNPRMFGAKEDGVTDDTESINRAINNIPYNGTLEFSKAAHYKAKDINLKSNMVINGNNATIIKVDGTTSSRIINMLGSETETETTLTGNAAVGDESLSVTDETGFSANDIVLIYDDSYAYTTYGRNQELNIVKSTEPGILALKNKIISNYTTANTATVTKLNAITDVLIKDLNLILEQDINGGGIYADLSMNITIQNTAIDGANQVPSIAVEQSAFITIDGNKIQNGQNQPVSGSGYGVSIRESSHNFVISNNIINNVRENMATNNARYGIFCNNVINDVYDSGFNTHGSGCKAITINNNVIAGSSGIGIAVGYSTHNAGDANVTISNNLITNTKSHGISISATVAKENSGIIVSNNQLVNVGMSGGSRYGILVSHSEYTLLDGNYINGNNTNIAYGVYLTDIAYSVNVRYNKIRNLLAGYGLAWNNINGGIIESNELVSISSTNLRSLGTNTNTIVKNNYCDDSSVLKGASGELWHNNWLGGNYIISGSTTWDPGTISNGSKVSTTVTVTGAALGDLVQCSVAYNLAGMKLFAYVSSANTVTVDIYNDTGGDITPGSKTVLAFIEK